MERRVLSSGTCRERERERDAERYNLINEIMKLYNGR